MSNIIFGGRSDIWSTNLGCASVGTPDIRLSPQTISYTEEHFRSPVSNVVQDEVLKLSAN